jgi:hypothetical protein
VLLALALLIAPRISLAAEPKQIDDAIRRGREYLYSMQKNGTWEKSPEPETGKARSDPNGDQWGGTTAICTYALLSAGESHEDPRLKPAIEFLLKADIKGVYAVAMRCQVLAMIPKSDAVKAAMQKDADFLKKAIHTGGAAKGLYDYLDEGPISSRIDHSVSQFGVLGAWSLADHLETFGADYWKMVDEAWRATQHENGAWSYSKAPTERYPETVAMTAAGVATLFITQDYVNRGKNLDAAGNASDPNIDKGIAWINKNYNTLLNGDRTAQYYPYYGLYGVERIGVASGFRFLGNVDWYKDGADFLVKDQNRNGGWTGSVQTAMAMLFLSRGRAPVVMNKLDYEITTGTGRAARTAEGNWNQRPRDAANLVRYIGRQTERTLNWQIVDFKATPQEMLSAPILYISGNQPLTFTAEQKQAIKSFIEQGGLILAHADGGSAPFAASIRRLGIELFKYEFRTLPASHPIYTNEQFQYSTWRRKTNVLAMSNGVRELILLLPDGDYARYWQAYDVGGRSELFELVADIFQYSVDKQNLRNKGESYLVKLDESIKPQTSIKVARLKYTGAWDPEPAGWTRLAAIVNNEQKVTLSTQVVDLAKLASASNVKIAHLTGVGAVRFTPAERDAIKTFVNAGNLLIIDAAGGSAQFCQSIETELDTILGATAKSLKEPLPADNPVYSLDGAKIPISYRPFAQKSLGSDLKIGRLRGIEINGKLAVVYSPEDLTEGLVGQPVDGVLGYSPQTATSLMMSVLTRNSH